jgi:hypothetical protein
MSSYWHEGQYFDDPDDWDEARRIADQDYEDMLRIDEKIRIREEEEDELNERTA